MRFSLSVLIITAIITSCAKEQFRSEAVRPANCDSTTFTFEKDIRPIFISTCNFTECHVSGEEGSYDFNIYEVVKGRILAGTMEYRLDLPPDDPQHMPEGLRLNPCDYYIIKTWIRQGFPEN